MAGKKTADKGLGWRHRQAVEFLKQMHKDGSPCDWCGQPLWLDPTKNHDYDPTRPGLRGNGVLQGDHSIQTRSESLRKGEPVLPPDRLLHAECNRMRGAGRMDHLAPTRVSRATAEPFAMPWPWAE